MEPKVILILASAVAFLAYHFYDVYRKQKKKPSAQVQKHYDNWVNQARTHHMNTILEEQFKNDYPEKHKQLAEKRIKVDNNNIYINNLDEALRNTSFEITPVIKFDESSPEISIFEDNKLVRKFIIEPLKSKPPLKGRYFHSSIRVNSNSSVQIDGIISDNRLGVHYKRVPCVFMTHQLNVLTGNTSYLTTKIHHYFINKFNECWIPDYATSPNLSGELGHLKKPLKHLRYLGPLSRIHKKELPKKYDYFVLLSGPEPQRTLLEEKLRKEFQSINKPTLFVKGVVENEQKISQEGNVTFYNYMNSKELEIAFNESDLIICRSGYTTIMDLAFLGKKAFFIPTPGQYEQEYLAKKLKSENIVPSCKQEKFKIEKLDKVSMYRGLQTFNNGTAVSWSQLFRLF